VVQILPGLFTLVYTQISPGHIWTILYFIIMTSHRISRNKIKSLRRLSYGLDSQRIRVRASVKAEIIGTSHYQKNFTNVNVNLFYHSITRYIDHIRVILSLTVGTKVRACRKCLKCVCQLDWDIIAVNSCTSIAFI